MRRMTPGTKGLFPLGIAVGTAHCDRREERVELARNITRGEHTWLWGRRRVGKTSLVEQVLRELPDRRVPSATVDLLLAHDGEELKARLQEAVERLGVAIASPGSRSLERVGSALRALAPEFSIGTAGVTLRLSPPAPQRRAITEMLMGLDRAAQARNRRVVIVLDEFQQVGRLTPASLARSLEGAIRHAVERSRQVVYVFSGSRRHLLAPMFEDRERPLFRLCRKLTLGRIAAADYADFLSQVGAERWGKAPSAEVRGEILELVGRHPYYLNALCSRLWDRNRPPTTGSVRSEWARIVDADGRAAAARLAGLPASQRALLGRIAREPGGLAEPGAHRVLAELRLPASTVNHARRMLERRDLIRRSQDHRWSLVDPVLASWLRATR